MEIVLFILIVAVILALVIYQHKRTSASESGVGSTEWAMDKEVAEPEGPLVYHGENLDFPEEVLRKVLVKHLPFFTRLIPPDQDKFIHRLKKFLKSKIFIIHDQKGYREMPILISASAIQLTFGLSKFLLPHFSLIQIFPQEFVAMEPMRILIGNVSGNTINIAWKQFLEGYKNRFGSQNVGLHEMAHALYYQNLEAEENIDKNFRESFRLFSSLADKIYAREKQLAMGLYSDYATRNFQEFWAESTELFFQNPERLHQYYPELYQIICDLLCLDPLRYPNHNYPV